MAKQYGRFEVRLPDEKFVFEPDDITLGEMHLLESELGPLTFDQWVRGIDERRALPVQVLVWFLRRKAGDQQERGSVDVPIRRLEIELLPDVAVEDPEAPAGSEPATS